MSFIKFSFFVPGRPAVAGSKKAFVNKKTGKASIVDTCERGQSWRVTVGSYAFTSYWSRNLSEVLIDEPIEMRMVFYFVRPRGHFSSSKKSPGGLKADAPNWPTGKPDTTKLIRAVEDALNGVIWRDDSIVVVQSARKVYADRPGCLVTISPALYPSDYEDGRMGKIMAALDDGA